MLKKRASTMSLTIIKENLLKILFPLTHPLSFLNAKSIFQIQLHCILIPFSYMQNNFFIALFLYMIHSP